MPVYIYKARDENGNLYKSSVESASEENVLEYLNRINLMPTEIKKIGFFNKDILDIDLFKQKVSKKDMYLFFRQFSQMIEAGLTISNSLIFIQNQVENKTLKASLHKITTEVLKGRLLSEAVKEQHLFPPIVPNMISIGEDTGKMDVVLSNLSKQFENEYTYLQTTKTAFIYPAFVLCLMSVFVVAALVFILPRFESMFLAFGGELPLITRILMSLSRFFTNYYLLVLCVITFIFIGVKRLFKSLRWKNMYDSIKLKFPLIGQFYILSTNAIFVRTLFLLISSGVPLVQSMQKAKLAISNSAIESAVDKATEEASSGRRISLTLSQYKFISPVFLNLIKTGEITGDVPKSIEKAADYLEMEFEEYTAYISKLVEPVITVIIGLIVAFVMMALILPIFNIAAVL